jgi:glycosyltransferase involved in cell wall biosynthesis
MSCRRFVFLGHVRSEKGIRELIVAGERFSGMGVEVTIFGPLAFDLTQSVFERRSVVRYAGVTDPEDVPRILAEHDCLVLPSYREGYSGSVVEAFAAGLPVVCSDLPSLREIVDESCGVLVPPGDSAALHSAMARLVDDQEMFQGLRKGVAKKRLEFDAVTWANAFVDYCHEVAESNKP